MAIVPTKGLAPPSVAANRSRARSDCPSVWLTAAGAEEPGGPLGFALGSDQFGRFDAERIERVVERSAHGQRRRQTATGDVVRLADPNANAASSAARYRSDASP